MRDHYALLGDIEREGDLGGGLRRFTIQVPRLINPLLYCRDGAGVKHRITADDAHIAEPAIFCDDGAQHDRALDTGATRTLVDKKIAERLSLRRRHGKVLNFDRYAEIELANLPELQLGPLLVRNVEVMVGDVKQFSELVEGVDAVIGLDLLRINRSLQIDYDARKVTFTSAGRRDPGKPRTPQAFMVRLPVQGQTILLVMDTGRQGMLLYADRLRKHTPQLKFTDTVAQAHEGRLTGQKAMLSGVRLGDDDLQVPAFLIDGAPNSLPPNIDGYLGTSVLNARMVEVDFEANRLRWE